MSGNHMNQMQFAKGMGVGLVVGATAGMVIKPKKKSGKKVISDAVKAVGDITETICDTMGW